MKPLLAAAFIVSLPVIAYADQGSDWRAKYEKMTDKEKDAFNKTRADIKSKVNQMSNEEREAFRRQIESQHGAAAGETIYIEAIPQGEDIDTYDTPKSEAKETGWKALSFEEKRKKYLEEKAE